MANLNAILKASLVASGTAQKTLLQITAPANQRVRIRELSVSFQGVSNTAAPVNVLLMIQTGGTASTGTLAPLDGDIAETIQTAGKITFTVEPAYSTVLGEYNVHPQTGIVIPLDITLKGGQIAGITVLAGATVPVSAYLKIEE